MPLRSLSISLVLMLSIGAGPLRAQTATTELDVTVGHSTERSDAVSSQLRIFGEAIGGWQYSLEGAWAHVWGNESDAFGAAYPYDGGIRPIELYAEKTMQRGRYLAGVRLGRYRTPFGIYSRSDHAYGGFLRAPLIRYGEDWGLSNNFLEGGASVAVGTPRLFAEASLGVPQDVNEEVERRFGLDRVVRVQGAFGAFVVGASHIRTRPPKERAFATGITEFTGADARWMSGGVQLRGEWVDGHPFSGTRTFGGYIDAIVHRSVLGPLTAVFRAERLDYLAGPFSRYPRRYTAGARVRLSNVLVGQVNFIRAHSDRDLPGGSGLDVALTFTTRR